MSSSGSDWWIAARSFGGAQPTDMSVRGEILAFAASADGCRR